MSRGISKNPEITKEKRRQRMLGNKYALGYKHSDQTLKIMSEKSTGANNGRWKGGISANINKYMRERYKTNPEKARIAVRKWVMVNREKQSESSRQWRIKNPKYANQYIKKQLISNPVFKLKYTLRSRFHSALKNNTKTGSAVKFLGCDIEKFKKYIEDQFQEGMNWKNHGLNGWHLDHIKPFASFDLADPKQQAEVCHYTNLQPLWATDNYKKNTKIYV